MAGTGTAPGENRLVSAECRVTEALGYASRVTTTTTPAAIDGTSPLPADDPGLFEQDLRGLRRRWAAAAARGPIGAEAMAGADRRAQAMGVPGRQLMEHAGTAVAAAAKALAEATGRWGRGPILVLAGPGNNGGDGFVAARQLARCGASVVAVLVSTAARPSTLDAARNWDRLHVEPKVSRVHASSPRELSLLARHIERAPVVVDALLGTGVHGVLRDPIRSAVELLLQARAKGVPVVAVDTPTAVDLSSGDPTDPVARADLTVTFHRPKTGLLTKRGAALAGKVLVAPIGIPREADRG
jgi:NAD(P)H-hydrate epimerase